MRRDAQAVVLLVVGAVLLKVSLDGGYVRYLRPGFGPLLVLAALAVLTIGAVTLRQVVQELRTRPVTDDDDLSTVDIPTADPRMVRRLGWPMLAGVLVVVLVAPPAAGAYQAGRTAAVAVDGTVNAPLPGGDPVRLSLTDYVRRAAAPGGGTLAGRELTLTGFVVVAANGRSYLARQSLECCAADARPVEVGLLGDLPDSVGADDWVEVDGGFVDLRDRDPVSGAVIPYLDVTAIRTIAPPSRPYE